jgi:hypothetical protein
LNKPLPRGKYGPDYDTNYDRIFGKKTPEDVKAAMNENPRARRAAEAILANLNDRSGLDLYLDDSIKEEMLQSWAKIIKGMMD